MSKLNLKELTENLALLKEAGKVLDELDLDKIQKIGNLPKPKVKQEYTPHERYDLSDPNNSLHIVGSDSGKEYSPEIYEGYMQVALMLSEGKAVEVDNDACEISFELAGKKWHFSLVKEACEIKALSCVMRILYDLIKSGELVYG